MPQPGFINGGFSFGSCGSDQIPPAVVPNVSSRATPAAAKFLSSSATPARSRNAVLVNNRPVSGPPVQSSVRNGQSVNLTTKTGGLLNSPGGGMPQLATATSLQSVQPGYAVAPNERLNPGGSGSSQRSSGSPSPALNIGTNLNCAPANSSTRPAQAWSARQPAIVMQQVNSCEVEWPLAQIATIPPRINRETTPDVGSFNSRPATTDYRRDGSSSDLADNVPATVVGTVLAFSAPFDSWTSSRTFVNQSPLSQTSSGSSTPSTTNSADVSPPLPPPPGKPPPPYPGRAPVNYPPALRPIPPLPNAVPSTTVEVAADDCQLIESPKPVRRAEACRKDAERSETRVRLHVHMFFCCYSKCPRITYSTISMRYCKSLFSVFHETLSSHHCALLTTIDLIQPGVMK